LASKNPQQGFIVDKGFPVDKGLVVEGESGPSQILLPLRFFPEAIPPVFGYASIFREGLIL
jgi:hypothetical protein